MGDKTGGFGRVRGQRLREAICRHHNILQLIGYEGGNLALLAQQGLAPHATAWPEAFAAAAFMVGSLTVCRFDPEKRPSLLMWGGIWLTLGGLMLAIAGYPLTGGAVMLASLETARGGLLLIASPVRRLTVWTRATAAVVMIYARLIDVTVARMRHFGPLIDSRPFLVGAIIKIPLRIEFILKNLLAGDLVGTAVGLAWMILGDGGLALNDQRLKQRLAPAPAIDATRAVSA